MIEQDRCNRSNLRQTQDPQTATLGGEPGSWIRNAPGRAPARMKLGHTQGRFEMGAFSDSYVLRVLLATPTRARNLDTVARQWRWLRTSLVDPYRSDPICTICVVPARNGGRSTAAALVATTRAPPSPSLQRTAQFRARILRGADRKWPTSRLPLIARQAAPGARRNSRSSQPRAFRSGGAIRPWSRCCCARESRWPVRHYPRWT